MQQEETRVYAFSATIVIEKLKIKIDSLGVRSSVLGVERYAQVEIATPLGLVGIRVQDKLTWGSTSRFRLQYRWGDKFHKNVPFRLLKGTIIVLLDAV